ncbi:hypothetical protein CEXT_420191, partial [Caerostris extrusa]
VHLLIKWVIVYIAIRIYNALQSKRRRFDLYDLRATGIRSSWFPNAAAGKRTGIALSGISLAGGEYPSKVTSCTFLLSWHVLNKDFDMKSM